MKRIPMPPESELRRLYLDGEQSTKDLGLLFGVSWMTVWRWLRRYGIPVRSAAEAGGRPRIKMPPESELRRLYLDKGLSAMDLGLRFHVSQPTALKWLNECGIQVRLSATKRKTS